MYMQSADPPYSMHHRHTWIAVVVIFCAFIAYTATQDRGSIGVLTGYVVSEQSENGTAMRQQAAEEPLSALEEQIVVELTSEESLVEELPLSSASAEETIQYPAEINKPVKWTKRVRTATPKKTVELPEYSTNVKVKKLNSGVEEDITHKATLRKKRASSSSLLTGFAVQESSSSNATIVAINEASEVTIEYETEAPSVYEEALTPYRKRVIVSSDIPYQNVSVYTTIAETSPQSVRLYWIVNDSRELVHDVVYSDTNANALVDRVAWTAPHLSNQTYEVEISVLNVQSYPTVGGDWAVEFTTAGTADLRIYASDGTTWTDDSESGYDLKFLSVFCGSQQVPVTFVKETEQCTTNTCYVSAANYTCGETARETSMVITPGRHVLHFIFGAEEAWAFNQATQTIVPNLLKHPAYTGTLAENTWTVGAPTAGSLACHDQINKTDIGQCSNTGGTATLDAYFFVNFTWPPYSSIQSIALKSRSAKITGIGDNLTLGLLNFTSGDLVLVNRTDNVTSRINWNITMTYNITTAGQIQNFVRGNRTQFMSRTFGGENDDMKQDYFEAVIFYELPRPSWYNMTVNATTIRQGDGVRFNATWVENGSDSRLIGFIFSINQSLVFVNSSYISFNTRWNISSNISNISAPAGTNVSWRFYANSTDGPLNATDVQTFVVAAAAAGDTALPTWSNMQRNETTVTRFMFVNFTTAWTDGTALAAFIFSINQSLVFVNSTAISFSGAPTAAGSSNVSQITAPVGTNISWRFYANDTVNTYFNVTVIESFIITNRIPNVTNLSAVPAQSITEAGAAKVSISFLAFDSDGVGDLNRSSARINISTPGNPIRFNNSCAYIADVGTFAANFTCIVDIQYFDAAGNWSIRASISDNSSALSVNESVNFTLLETLAMRVGPSPLSFATVSPSGENITSTNDPITVNNTGNVNVTTNNTQVRALDLIGESNTAFIIPAGNFTVDVNTGAGNPECGVRSVMTNFTFVNITNAILPRGNNSAGVNPVNGVELLYVCLRGAPLGGQLPSQSYGASGDRAWTILVGV